MIDRTWWINNAPASADDDVLPLFWQQTPPQIQKSWHHSGHEPNFGSFLNENPHQLPSLKLTAEPCTWKYGIPKGKACFVFQPSIFRGENISFREGMLEKNPSNFESKIFHPPSSTASKPLMAPSSTQSSTYQNTTTTAPSKGSLFQGVWPLDFTQ